MSEQSPEENVHAPFNHYPAGWSKIEGVELLVLGLALYVVGRWAVKRAGPMPHLCRGCARIYYGSLCPNCCEHGSDRPNCEQCFLEGKRVDIDSIAVTGEYEPPEAHWASQDAEPGDAELFGNA